VAPAATSTSPRTISEYSRYLRDLAAAGRIGTAQSFPSVLDAAAGDPRTRYSETNIRPWFVVFDGSASTYRPMRF
jgi:hypothetical protein